VIPRTVGFVLLTAVLAAQGCAVVGQSLGVVGQLIDLAISLALAAAPFVLAYYLYRRDKD
jgi:ABC-type methionine transport system permease subunit